MKSLIPFLSKSITVTLVMGVFVSSCSNDLSLVSVKSEFTSDRNKIIEGNQISFTELSEGEPTSWSWTFEGGTPATSTEKTCSNV